ncbi:MAG: alpha/beta hydrolase [bacterium]
MSQIGSMGLISRTVTAPDSELPSGAAGLHVVEKGSGSKAIMFIHGLGADHYEFIHQIRYFSNRYRCIAFDQRGFGRSPATHNMSIERSVWDTLALADHFGLDRFILMGHSLGTMVAFDFAARFGERLEKLIIVSGSPAIRESRGTYAGLRVLPNLEKLFDDRQRRFMGNAVAFNIGAFGLRTSPDVLRHYTREDPYVFSDKYFSTCMKYMKEIADFDCRSRLRRITVPTLVVHGALDLGIYASTALTAATRVPGAKLFIFPTCGHSPNIESPGNFNRVVEKFIKG